MMLFCERLFVVTIANFKCCFGYAKVNFFFITRNVCRDICLVDNTLSKTLPFKGHCFLFAQLQSWVSVFLCWAFSKMFLLCLCILAYIYIHKFFHLKFVKMINLFIFLALKQPNSEEYIFAVYKHSWSLLKRTLSLKFLSNNLSLWLFLWLASPSQILIILNLILHNFILVSKSNSPVSKLFIVTRIRCVLNLHPNLRQYQINNVA